MESKELIKLLKNENSTIYGVVKDNLKKINKKQLEDIILEFFLHVSLYIDNRTIQNHFYNDLIGQLEKDWNNEEQ